MTNTLPNPSWWVYLVVCADGTYYCGATNDVLGRVATHNAAKGAKYTRSRLPVTLVYQESCKDRSAAQIREAEIKRLNRTQKSELVRGFVVK